MLDPDSKNDGHGGFPPSAPACTLRGEGWVGRIEQHRPCKGLDPSWRGLALASHSEVSLRGGIYHYGNCFPSTGAKMKLCGCPTVTGVSSDESLQGRALFLLLKGDRLEAGGEASE